MRAVSVSVVAALALLVVFIACLGNLSTVNAAESSSSGSSRSLKKIQVARSGFFTPFELTRSAELKAPLFALRKQFSSKFKDIRYKNFFKLDGTPLDEYSQAPEEGVVVQRPGDQWFWPSIRTNYGNDIIVEESTRMMLLTVSPIPRLFTIDDFATKEECDYIIAKSKELGVLRTPQPNHPNNTGTVVDFGDSHYLHSDPIFAKLFKRAASLVRQPMERGEAEILHFVKDQYYGTHHDYAMISTINDPQRYVVVTLYLNEVEGGGKVAFPGTNFGLANKQHKYLEPTICTEDPETWKMVPKTGAATMHYLLKEDAHMQNMLDSHAVRYDCTVEKGEKWAVNFFFYNRNPHLRSNGANEQQQSDELPLSNNADGSVTVDASV